MRASSQAAIPNRYRVFIHQQCSECLIVSQFTKSESNRGSDREHSDFTFQHVYGDKECFHLAWRKLNTEYAMPKAGPGWNTHTIVQYDFHGQIVFPHRCQDKWRFGGNRFVDSLADENLCFELVRELASKWSGILWRNDAPTESEKATIDSLVGRRARYRRVGFDERFIRFDSERMIGEGSAECERLWEVNEMNGETVLTLSRIDRPTCHLRRDHEGVWRGAWLEHEKMPIELVPFAQWTPVQDRIEPKRDLLIITIATGKTFNELLEVTGPVLEQYADNVGADFVALTNATQQWWGLEKFRVLEFAKQYERILYIDADVILRDSAPNLFELVPRGYVAMHDDWPHLPSYDWLWTERAAILGSQGRPMDHMETAWNTGIVLCDRDQADIWQPPLAPFLPSHCAEQFWIESSARKYPFFRIPTELNTQYWMPRFNELLPAAKIVHLANCPNSKRVELARQLVQTAIHQ